MSQMGGKVLFHQRVQGSFIVRLGVVRGSCHLRTPFVVLCCLGGTSRSMFGPGVGVGSPSTGSRLWQVGDTSVEFSVPVLRLSQSLLRLPRFLLGETDRSSIRSFLYSDYYLCGMLLPYSHLFKIVYRILIDLFCVYDFLDFCCLLLESCDESQILTNCLFLFLLFLLGLLN